MENYHNERKQQNNQGLVINEIFQKSLLEYRHPNPKSLHNPKANLGEKQKIYAILSSNISVSLNRDFFMPVLYPLEVFSFAL